MAVMRTGRESVLEEEYNGITYLSVKYPLIIGEKFEGTIGSAVDITARKSWKCRANYDYNYQKMCMYLRSGWRMI
jgi:hypothetical protein